MAVSSEQPVNYIHVKKITKQRCRPILDQGSEKKKLEFQLALRTSGSQMLLVLGKSKFTFLVGKQLAWTLAHQASESEKLHYLPSRQIYLCRMTKQHFFQALFDVQED